MFATRGPVTDDERGRLRVLLAGLSARAAAESAARAGFDVTAIDAFGDLDQHPAVRTLSRVGKVHKLFTPPRAARVSRTIPCDAVAYLSGFENHPGAVRTLSAGRTLWGNSPDVLRRVRDPIRLMEAVRAPGLSAPDVAMERPGETGGRWLLKPLASGGGQRVRPWRPGEELPRGCYLQEYVPGTPLSLIFVAAEKRMVPLGFSRQLVGDAAFGASGFRYCGNILPAAGHLEGAPRLRLLESACAVAAAVTEAFGLVGLNGIDFMARGDEALPLEVNPRWTGAMELVEWAGGPSLFGVHAAACRDGVLPPGRLGADADGFHAGVVGKAIVFARQAVTVAGRAPWDALGPPGTLRDLSPPGETIRAGHPVCTVLAVADDEPGCRLALERRAGAVYRRLAEWAKDARRECRGPR